MFTRKNKTMEDPNCHNYDIDSLYRERFSDSEDQPEK